MRFGQTKCKVDWRATASRAVGILVLLAAVLLAASLCGASTPADHPVTSIFDPLEQGLPDRLIREDRRNGEVLGNFVRRVLEDRDRFALELLRELARGGGGRRREGERRWTRDGRQDRELGVLAAGQVDCLLERVLGVFGTVDADEDVEEHGSSFRIEPTGTKQSLYVKLSMPIIG